MTDKTLSDFVLENFKKKKLFELSKEGDLTESAKKHLRELSTKSPQQLLDAMVSEIATGMMHPVSSSFPELGKSGAIRVRQVVDRRIEAAVSKKRPYVLNVSSSLVAFTSAMLNTLMSGIGIVLEDEPGAPMLKPRSTKAVATDIKQLLDDHIAKRPIPFLDSQAVGARYMIQLRMFNCALSWVLGHELGHIVVTESRNQKKEAPFEPFATAALEQNFDRILQKERFQGALTSLSEAQYVAIFDHWLTEINADILGASLACGFQKDHGITRAAPNVVAFTKVSIHLILLSQYMLDSYKNLLDQRYKLISHEHPPIDFRMHCVLMWMYRDMMKDATKTIVAYMQGVMTEVLRQSK